MLRFSILVTAIYSPAAVIHHKLFKGQTSESWRKSSRKKAKIKKLKEKKGCRLVLLACYFFLIVVVVVVFIEHFIKETDMF